MKKLILFLIINVCVFSVLYPQKKITPNKTNVQTNSTSQAKDVYFDEFTLQQENDVEFMTCKGLSITRNISSSTSERYYTFDISDSRFTQRISTANESKFKVGDYNYRYNAIISTSKYPEIDKGYYLYSVKPLSYFFEKSYKFDNVESKIKLSIFSTYKDGPFIKESIDEIVIKPLSKADKPEIKQIGVFNIPSKKINSDGKVEYCEQNISKIIFSANIVTWAANGKGGVDISQKWTISIKLDEVELKSEKGIYKKFYILNHSYDKQWSAEKFNLTEDAVNDTHELILSCSDNDYNITIMTHSNVKPREEYSFNQPGDVKKIESE